MPRFLDQLREVSDITYSGIGVSRDGGEHQHLNCQSAHRQNQTKSGKFGLKQPEFSIWPPFQLVFFHNFWAN